MNRPSLLIALLSQVALATAAIPFTAAAGSGVGAEPQRGDAALGPEPGAKDSEGQAEARAAPAREVSFRPLFDTNRRFKPGKTYKLRFRVQERRSGESVPAADISASLFHQKDGEMRLSMHQIEGAVYEVPFKPRGPGQYRLVVTVRGTTAGSIRPVLLGVVGVVGGGKEVPVSDAELETRSRRLKGKAR